MTEEDKMWESGQLGSHDPMALTRTVWYQLSMSFGLRGRHEARQMMWGDVALKSDSEGKQYLEFSERLTKTRTGAEASGSRAFPPKAFQADNQERCPVPSTHVQGVRQTPTDRVLCPGEPIFSRSKLQKKARQ